MLGAASCCALGFLFAPLLNTWGGVRVVVHTLCNATFGFLCRVRRKTNGSCFAQRRRKKSGALLMQTPTSTATQRMGLHRSELTDVSEVSAKVQNRVEKSAHWLVLSHQPCMPHACSHWRHGKAPSPRSCSRYCRNILIIIQRNSRSCRARCARFCHTRNSMRCRGRSFIG